MGEYLDDVDAVRPVLFEQALLPDDTVGVFISGSLARGWGTPTSDLDVHVLTSAQWPGSLSETTQVSLTPDTLTYERTFVDGRRWDIEYWTAGQLEQLLDKVSRDDFERGSQAWSTLTTAEIGMLERLPYAAAGRDDLAWLSGVQHALAASAQRTVLAAMSMRKADGYLEDTAGLLKSGELTSAVLTARLAFGHAVDALQTANGQFGTEWPKWRARRMTLINSDVLCFDDYWRLETMVDLDPDDPVGWIRQAVGVCRRISASVES